MEGPYEKLGTQQYRCYSWTRLFAFLKCLLEKRASCYFDIKGMILELSRREQRLSLQIPLLATNLQNQADNGAITKQWATQIRVKIRKVMTNIVPFYLLLKFSLVVLLSAAAFRMQHFRVEDRQSTHHRVSTPLPLLFHSLCHPKPLFVLKRPWQCSQSQSERDAIVAECVRMSFSRDVCWAPLVCESGSSWKQDHRWAQRSMSGGKDGIRLIPTRLGID